jgi:hypothetical protein
VRTAGPPSLASVAKEFLMRRGLISGCLTVFGVLLLAQHIEAANPAVGRWKLYQPSVGESELKITEKDDKLEVQEVGLGNVKSRIASYEDGLLVVHWQGGEDFTGYWMLHLNKDDTRGTGKTVFTRYGADFSAGEEHKIQDRTVRVVKDVTIERIKE